MKLKTKKYQLYAQKIIIKCNRKNVEAQFTSPIVQILQENQFDLEESKHPSIGPMRSMSISDVTTVNLFLTSDFLLAPCV